MKTCSKCGEEKSENCFWPDRRRGRLAARCKDCNREHAKAYQARVPSYYKDRYAKVKSRVRINHLKRKYGLSAEGYEKLLAAQSGKCAICLVPAVTQAHGVLHVGHCHETGAVRGLLCRGCNHTLGAMKDDVANLRRAISYLEKSAYLDTE